MKISDQKAWEECRGSYSKKVMKFAQDLANLIEARMANGSSLPDVAESAVQELANRDGTIPKPMREAVITVLARTWVHGKAFKHWEKKASVGREG